MITEKVPASEGTPRPRRGIVALLVCLALIEAVSWVVIASRGASFFEKFVSVPDTGSYLRAAQALAETGQLIATPRTLGYPLFLASVYRLCGSANAPFVVIAIQLLSNLFLAYGGWRLVTRLAPTAGEGLCLTLTGILGWAGMGMAWRLWTDSLGGIAFFGFLYGLLFWRRPPGIALSALSLFAASILRPAFTLLPLLIPVLAWIVGRVTQRVRWSQIAALILGSVAGTFINVAYQYRNYGYAGPSPVVSLGLRNAHWHAFERGRFDRFSEFEADFLRRVEQRASRPIDSLSPGEEERITKTLFWEAAKAHPRAFVAYFGSGAAKYIFVPIESFVDQAITSTRGYRYFYTYVRPFLFVLCLPFWLLAIAPPIGSVHQIRWYWLLVMLVGAYLIGVSALLPTQGERYRFPAMAFTLPIIAQNVRALSSWIRRSTQSGISSSAKSIR